MAEKKLSYFNKVEVVGVVTSFNIKDLKNGGRLANIGVRDDATTNLTYISVFDRKGLKYGDAETTLDGLRKIFMDANGNSRHVCAKFTGRARETVSDGKTYFNVSAFKVEPASESDEHYAILIVNGVVDAIKVAESDGEPYARIKVGVQNNNRDGDITGVDFITVMAHGEKLVDKLEDVEKMSFIKLQCDLVNTLPKTDRFGNIIGSGEKETAVVNITGVTDPYDIEDINEDFIPLYKKAKRLERGEVIKVDKGDEGLAQTPTPAPTTKVVVDDNLEDDLDF